MSKKFKRKSPNHNNVKCLGMRIKKLQSGTFELSSNGYEKDIRQVEIKAGRAKQVDSLLNEKEEGEFRALLGKLMRLARITRGDITVDVAQIAQVYKNGRRTEQNYEMDEIDVRPDPEPDEDAKPWGKIEKTN